MNKPDFSTMTRQELRTYALAHREDDAVFTEIIKRTSGTGKVYPYPQTEADLEEIRLAIQRKTHGEDRAG